MYVNRLKKLQVYKPQISEVHVVIYIKNNSYIFCNSTGLMVNYKQLYL